jgi:hypothetical protein
VFFPEIDPKKASHADDWRQFIVDQIRERRAVPIISNQVHNDLVLDGNADLAIGFARHNNLELSDPRKLAELTQFISTIAGTDAELSVKRQYLEYCRQRLLEMARKDPDLVDQVDDVAREPNVSKVAAAFGYPQYGDPTQDPLLILARLELPVYLTTSYHDFMERALIRNKKRPLSLYCPWQRGDRIQGTNAVPEDYTPTPEEPLVYHLHGIDTDSESLVLTEDDYLAYLVAVTSERGRSTDPIADCVRKALSGSSLILLGYDLSAWDFRTLMWGLIKGRPRERKSVCVLQLDPGAAEAGYLKKYLDKVNFKVEWGDLRTYARGLEDKVHP